MGNSGTLNTLQLEDIAAECGQQSQRYRELGQAHSDPRYCYELFRRAIVEGLESAWTHVYTAYEGQIVRWVRQCSSYHATGQDAEYFVSIIYTKFWKAVTPDLFSNHLLSLGAVLAYLKRCVQTTLIDFVRSRRKDQMLDELDELERVKVPSADNRPIEQRASRGSDSEALWQQIGELLKNEQERIVLEEVFLLDKKANQIFADHPDTFESVKTIYRIKENLLKRLRRSNSLAEWRN